MGGVVGTCAKVAHARCGGLSRILQFGKTLACSPPQTTCPPRTCGPSFQALDVSAPQILMKKARLQLCFLLLAIVALIGVNLPMAFPLFYRSVKGTQHAVGPDIVSVYLSAPDYSVPLVSVRQGASANPNESLAETGQRVSVYLRNNYREKEIYYAPRLTLWIILGFGTGFCIINWMTGRKPTTSQ